MSPKPKQRSHRGRSQSSACWIVGKQALPVAGAAGVTPNLQEASIQLLKVDLAISVPKRVVKRAVWRNYAKRVAREAWRGLPEPFVQQASAPFFVLLRLKQLPTAEMIGGIAGARAVKRQLRLECDQVLGRLLRNL